MLGGTVSIVVQSVGIGSDTFRSRATRSGAQRLLYYVYLIHVLPTLLRRPRCLIARLIVDELSTRALHLGVLVDLLVCFGSASGTVLVRDAKW